MQRHRNFEACVCKHRENKQPTQYDFNFQIGLYRLFFDIFILFHAESENGNHRENHKTNPEKHDVNELFHIGSPVCRQSSRETAWNSPRPGLSLGERLSRS